MTNLVQLVKINLTILLIVKIPCTEKKKEKKKERGNKG